MPRGYWFGGEFFRTLLGCLPTIPKKLFSPEDPIGPRKRSTGLFFLVGYVEERLWGPIQSPNTGGKKKASS